MENVAIAIVGGGLAGLQAARLVHARGLGFRLLEARERLGGRILTAPVDGNVGDGFDLGPSWYWPGLHPTMAKTVTELDLVAFPQHDDGEVLVERAPNRPPQRYAGFRSEPRSMRVVGGMGSLVKAVAASLPAGAVRLGAKVTRLSLHEDSVALSMLGTGGGEQALTAGWVILALPPRLLEATIDFEPALKAGTRRRWGDTVTWMAPHAKFFALYDRPFWREAGLSGMAQSAVGPLAEIHDGTTASGAPALFGFVGVDANRRAAAGEAALKQACIDQLVRLFGPAAAQASTTLLKDWTADPLTATARDRNGGDHPAPQMAPWISGPWSHRVSLAGSETSARAPGYLAGAIDAAQRAVTEALDGLQSNGLGPAGRRA